jgi:hypothetical protein
MAQVIAAEALPPSFCSTRTKNKGDADQIAQRIVSAIKARAEFQTRGIALVGVMRNNV